MVTIKKIERARGEFPAGPSSRSNYYLPAEAAASVFAALAALCLLWVLWVFFSIAGV